MVERDDALGIHHLAALDHGQRFVEGDLVNLDLLASLMLQAAPFEVVGAEEMDALVREAG